MFYPGARVHDYGKDSAELLFKRISSDGFMGIQLAFKKAIAGVERFYDITPDLVQSVKACCKRTHLSVAVLGAYVEPSYVNEALRRESVREFCCSLPVAKELEASCIGTETTNMEKQPGVSRADALKSLVCSLGEIMPMAENIGMDVAIEPVYYHTMNTPELTKVVLDAIQSPRLKVIFDPVNLLSPDELPHQQKLWDRCFDCFGDRIAAVHLKGITQDTAGNQKNAPLEESIVDYPAIFAGLKQLERDFFVMREKIVPEHAKQDLTFMKSLF